MSSLETIFSTTCRQSIADLKELKQLGSVSDTVSSIRTYFESLSDW